MIFHMKVFNTCLMKNLNQLAFEIDQDVLKKLKNQKNYQQRKDI